MWKPSHQGLDELMKLFDNFNSQDNKLQSEIYNKVNDYAKHKEFPMYLIYILNSEHKVELRQVAGLTLKGIMERSFIELSEESIEYFKQNITHKYLDDNLTIRKTISNLINTFVRLGGVEMWPEILDFLLQNLDINSGADMSLETLNIIIEDSGSHLEEKCYPFLIKLLHKFVLFLNQIKTGASGESNFFIDLLNLVLTSIYVLLENCPNLMNEKLDNVAQVLVNLHDIQNVPTRYHISRCWITILKMNKMILDSMLDNLFDFFLQNLKVDNYQNNFTAAEFFSILIKGEEESKIGNKPTLFRLEEVYGKKIEDNLKELLNYLVHFMKLTVHDITGMENRISEDKSQLLSEEVETEELEEESEGYNPNFTLRKCCSKLLDNLAGIYPQTLFEILKPVLERDMQHSDWKIKERSILALGAIANGAYAFIKPHLANLIPFLIRELTHSNKLVRAISCWTLSRFTNFILVDNISENSYLLFKDYLVEILKQFFDKEVIVQEAACTAFSKMVVTKKDKLEPFLYDIFKVISDVFDQYTGTSLLTLYDIVSFLTEFYQEHFKNHNLIEKVVNCVVRKWYGLVKSGDYKNISPLFEMICSIIKVASNFTQQFFDYFLNGSLILLETNLNLYYTHKDASYFDRELLSNSLDLLSVLCQFYPSLVAESPNKFKILDSILKLAEFDDYYVKHYILALIGDLAQLDSEILNDKFEIVISLICVCLDLPDNRQGSLDVERLSTCNNACWTIGLIALNYPKQISSRVNPILKQLLKMMSLPKLNKSLAQNISICIGRLAMIDSQSVSCYLDSFLKQFCLSIRFIKDSAEKRQSFGGLCKAILHNPNGVMNFFVFFCDAICQYEDAPADMESLFQNIVLSYKNTLRERWMDYFQSFPDKLKAKMTNRFRLI